MFAFLGPHINRRLQPSTHMFLKLLDILQWGLLKYIALEEKKKHFYNIHVNKSH